MKKIANFDVKDLDVARDRLGARSLAKTFPELEQFLRPDSRVLDVGCGPGSITFDVAAAVPEGAVVGVDVIEKWIDQNRALAAERGVENVEFLHSDSQFLDLESDQFDVTYSHQALQYILDPVQALSEQKRVTKPGGWVLAVVGMGGDVYRHPPMPAMRKVDDARARYAAHLQATYKPGDQYPGFFNEPYAGRHLVQWLRKAKLEPFDIVVRAGTVNAVEHPGTEEFSSDSALRRLDLDGMRGPFWRAIIDGGFIDEQTLQVTTRKAAGTRLDLEFYPARDLVTAERTSERRSSWM